VIWHYPLWRDVLLLVAAFPLVYYLLAIVVAL